MSAFPSASETGTRRATARGFLHIFGLTTLGIAQPIYDLLSRSPGFFSARQVTGAGLVSLAAILLLLPPVLLGVPAALSERLWGRSAGERAVAAGIAGAAGILALLVLKRAPVLPGVAALGLAVLAAVAFSALYRRLEGLRRFLDLLALFAIVAPVFFVVRNLPHRVAGGGSVELPMVQASPVPVVVVIFDELPVSSLMDGQGAIDRALFPAFSALARTSNWYRNTTAVASLTQEAMPAILTGRYPRTSLPAIAENHPYSLFTLLGRSHEILEIEPRTALCPSELCGPGAALDTGTVLVDLSVVFLNLLLPEELAHFLPQVGTTWGGFVELEDKAEEFRALVGRIDVTAQPPLIVLHSLLPHHPWIYTDAGRRYHPGDEMFIDGLGPGGAAAGRWVDDRWTVIQGLQRHLLQLRFTDRLLGELVDRLQGLGLFVPSLLIVTADHGIAFEPGAKARACTVENYAEVLGVPLLIKLPFQTRGMIDERPAEVVDILPTIVQVLGVQPGWSFDGRSLLSSGGPRRVKRRVYNDDEHILELRDIDLLGRFAAARRKLAQFEPAAGGETIDLFRPGPPPPGVLGESVDAIRLAQGGWIAEIDNLGDLQSGDLTRGFLPNRVNGRVKDLPAPRRLQLALAVDGVLRATTWTRPEPDRSGDFSFLLPTDALGPGFREVSLFHLDGDLRFEKVALDQPLSWRLEGRGTGPVTIRDAEGRSWRVSHGLFEGEVVDALIRERADRVDFIGWARRSDDAEPATSIVMFVDGHFRHAGPPNLQEPRQRGRYLLPGREDSAFVFTLPNNDLEGEITFFALSSDGLASELPYTRRMEPQSLP